MSTELLSELTVSKPAAQQQVFGSAISAQTSEMPCSAWRMGSCAAACYPRELLLEDFLLLLCKSFALLFVIRWLKCFQCEIYSNREDISAAYGAWKRYFQEARSSAGVASVACDGNTLQHCAVTDNDHCTGCGCLSQERVDSLNRRIKKVSSGWRGVTACPGAASR